MAKKTVVKFTGIKTARDNALEFLNKSTKDPKFLTSVAEVTVDQIQKAVRSAGRVDSAYFQPPLSDSTIKRRETLIKQGNAYNTTIVTPKRSNLSMSGQLMDSISYRINQSLSEITLFLKRPRTAYKGKNGQPLENKDNVEIKRDLEKRGYKFFFVSDKINTLLVNRISKSLSRLLKLYDKVKRKPR